MRKVGCGGQVLRLVRKVGCGGQVLRLVRKVRCGWQVLRLVRKKHTLIPHDYLDNFFSHDKSLAFLFNFRQKVVGMGQK